MLVSATAPNIGDIAAWIGSGVTESEPAHVYEVNSSYNLISQEFIKFANVVWR